MKLWPLQQAIYARLVEYQPLVDLLAANVIIAGEPAVYDHVPQAVTEAAEGFPFVSIGDDAGIPFDTDTSVGREVTLTLNIWSRYSGRKEVREIADALHGALHRYELEVEGAHVVTCECEDGGSLLDPDGVTRHGTMEVRIVMEEE